MFKNNLILEDIAKLFFKCHTFIGQGRFLDNQMIVSDEKKSFES